MLICVNFCALIWFIYFYIVSLHCENKIKAKRVLLFHKSSLTCLPRRREMRCTKRHPEGGRKKALTDGTQSTVTLRAKTAGAIPFGLKDATHRPRSHGHHWRWHFGRDRGCIPIRLKDASRRPRSHRHHFLIAVRWLIPSILCVKTVCSARIKGHKPACPAAETDSCDRRRGRKRMQIRAGPFPRPATK